MAIRVAIPLTYEENTLLEEIAREYGETKAYVLKHFALEKMLELKRRK